MSQDSELSLRRSLDSIDSFKRRMLLTGWVAVACSIGSFLWMNYVLHSTDNVKRLLSATVLALVSVIAWATFAIVICIVRMTKRILRAIHIAALDKRESGPGS